MAYITGLILIDAPASALNNAGADEMARTDNAVAVKFIRTARGALPYISAQAFRYWLRTTLDRDKVQSGWQSAPVYRESKIAYTDANPFQWWDDDLFGYMRAQAKSPKVAKKRAEDTGRVGETPVTADITRISPFRISTLVSIAPTQLVSDFGTMSRHDGDAVPHEHQFYRTVLKGLLSLDLHAAGTFSYRDRTGYRNLDEVRRGIAQERSDVSHVEAEQSYRLPERERVQRVAALLRGLGLVSGGAKQTIHYTDVSPAVVLAMVTRGGNNPLQYVIGADTSGSPRVHTEGLSEVARVWGDQILSPLYIGWVQGFQDSERERLVASCEDLSKLKTESGLPKTEPSLPKGYSIGHPREALEALAKAVEDNASTWLA